MGRPRPWLRTVAWPYAAATAAVLALWFSPVELPALQLVDLATFWWTLPAVALVVVAALARDGRALALLAVPALTWSWSYGGAFLPPDVPDVAADLRVVSFNTFVGAPDADHVLDLVDRVEPDVLLLQEVFADREGTLRTELADTLPFVHTDASDGVGSVAVFSRHPVLDVTTIGDASERSRSTSVVALDVDGRRLQVASVHLISPCPGCGPSVLERLELEDDVRAAEIGALLAALDPQVPAVVGGDLNSNDRSTAYRRLVAAGFTDAQRDAGRGMGFTWPADGRLPPLVRIDWLLTRGVRAVDAGVEHGGASDHRPVVADVAFDAPHEDG